MRPVTALFAVIIVAVLALSVVVVSRLHRSGTHWHDVAQQRLLFGVPWGSLVVIAIVVAVYLFVQDGITNLTEPVTIPYRAWSYFTPLGIATASFSHASLGHLTGNLAGAAVAAPIAEYAWGHFPGRDRADNTHSHDGERGGVRSQLESLRTTPWIRAFVLFPLAVVVLSFVTSLFGLGPVIGFSSIIFAFAGFAIVHYPIATLIATVAVQSALLTVSRALQDAVSVYVATPSPASAPSWAGIAIQGHALGFFIGLVLGLLVLKRRNERPNPFHLWLAVLLYAFSKGLWQIYWFGEGNTYLLFRGPGVAIVVILALVITLASAAPDRPVPKRPVRRLFRRLTGADSRKGRPPSESSSVGNEGPDASHHSRTERVLELSGVGGGGESESKVEVEDEDEPVSPSSDVSGDSLDRIRELSIGATPNSGEESHTQTPAETTASRMTQRGVAFLAVALVLAVLAGMAIPVNLAVVESASDGTAPGAIEVDDYVIEYDENASNQLVSGIGLDVAIDDAGLAGSGVIVSNERHSIWLEAVTKEQLEATGYETVIVGEPGWRETVHVERTGWEPVGGESVYQVWLWLDGDEENRQLAHESEESIAEAIINDRTVTLGSDDGEFVLEVEEIETETTSTTAVPDENGSVEAGGVVFERTEDTLVASSDGTEVVIATMEDHEY
ncbi:rhomboid family protein [Natrialba magadii ATCC 43099]|uniref:Rhomboid family protein n=1 Tax=Natrialba magadii (strain ATCC 43099 / DSM 3394 / CCM 3739 / CIP 104546 / IAM 13178 / JCM 8861 / NBRC 102185 / NCIMB 2190 / MS3) TaxID=547559 RepID=D3SU40_NATMM|nr:rhomboid family intramembrane serine protease [Natrialba magadii]ADD07129.1 rhomboid family protein [Natrialba magadii ATCC 43099]ELY29095.1 rhomboid family protein [Natrialba magadii ATCC 43099]